MKPDRERLEFLSLRSIGSLLLIIVLATLFIWVSFNLDVPPPQELRDIILDYGWSGFLIFLGIAIAIAITPIPVTIPALVAGSLYGVIGGSILSFSGVMIGSWIAYWLARFAGQRLVFQLLGRHSKIVERYLNDAGFWTLCTVRLIPGLPYWPINYGAGALGVKQYTFLPATMLASAPGLVSLVALSAFAVTPNLFNGVVLAAAWITVILLVVISYRHWRLDSKDIQDKKNSET